MVCVRAHPVPSSRDSPLALHGITAQLEDAIAPQNVSPRFDSGDLVLATAIVYLELVIRAHVDPDVIDNMRPSLLKTPRHAFVGKFRGTWLSSVRWFVQFLRSTGAAILSGGPGSRGLASRF